MSKVLIVNVAKCMGCDTCVVACKDEFYDNDWSPYSKPQPRKAFWMTLNTVERGEIPRLRVSHVATPCMQCEDAPCQQAATGQAVYTRSDGIVMIDPVRSVGQKQLVASCPYGVIYWNEALNIPQKCTFCAHLLDRGWTDPRCVKGCPLDALTFGDYEDLQSTIQQSGAVPLHPEFGTKPRVYYIGLPKTMITAAVIDSNGECLEGVDATAKDTTSGTTVKTTSNAFGHVYLDGLEAKKTYDVTFSKAGKTKTMTVTLETDKELGDITLA
jgi:tetrathionate reductase subunit B